MRALLSYASARDKDVSGSLYVAIENGHENIVALLVEACTSLNSGPLGLPVALIHRALRSAMSEPVVNAILAIVYAIESQSEFNLREASDRGHEGAIVLLSYAETLKD